MRKPVLLAMLGCSAFLWIPQNAAFGLMPSSMQAIAQICAPRLDGRGCSKTICPATGELCQPTVVGCAEDGHCEIVECDCLTQRQCHVRLTQAGGVTRPVCTGQCIPGWECELNRKPAEDGTMYFWCECDEIPCEPAADGLRCRKSRCDSNNERCQPSVVECDANGRCHVEECDCEPQTTCRLRVPGNGTLPPGFQFCVGPCPEGTRCEETRVPIPGGGFQVKCDCTSDACEPTDDGLRCREVGCPTNQQCLPELVVCRPNGECHVERCDCDGRATCHPQINNDPALPPVECVGACPEGTVCEMRREVAADGTVIIRCECVPQACEPDDSGLRCTDVACPIPGQECRPTRVLCGPNEECRVLDCDCANPQFCHVEITATAGPICVGACPAGTDCTRHVTMTGTGTIVECRCDPIQACGPDETGQGCRDVQCPTATQKCTPTLIVCDPAGACRVERCDCIDEARCHPEINPEGDEPPVICVGECPPGQICEPFREQTPTGQILFGCRCVPETNCAPDDSGLGCQDVTCPNPNERCIPREVVCIPGALCRVVSCDCQDPERCHVEITAAAGPVCVGACPAGTECRQTNGTLPDGTTTTRCDCIGIPQCRPEPNTLTGCSNTPCPTNNERCTPIKIVCGVNGGCRVVACDCRDPQTCHVAQPSPTVPPTCVGSCPPGTTCERDVVVVTPDACALPADPGPCDAAIPRWFFNTEANACEMFVYGGCGGNANNFLTQEDCAASCPNGGTAIQCHCIDDPVCRPDETGLRCENVDCPDATQECRPSRVFCTANNQCRVVDCDCRDADACHVEISIAAGPTCVGACPPGTDCVRHVTEANGGRFVECRCEPIVACGPDDTGLHCRQVVCPVATQRCLPTKLVCGPNGCRIDGCECRDPDACHIETDSTNIPICVGACPPGTDCTRSITTDPAGVTTFECRCQPATECEPDLTSPTGCRLIQCPTPNERCLPTQAICTAAGCRPVDCECQPFDGCRVRITPNGAFCDGACPPGSACQRSETQTDEGTLVECNCVPVAVCAPDDSGLGCQDVVCPIDTEKCVPQRFVCDENGNCRVARCGCQDSDRCHPELNPNDTGTPVICLGECPRGQTCEIFRETSSAGEVLIGCRCVPPTNCEPDPTSPTGCRLILCPTPNERCLPTQAICTPAGCRPLDCECQPFDGCRVQISPNGAFCAGACPPGSVCERHETETSEGTIVECRCSNSEPECGPNSTSTGCLPITCPNPDEKCIPTRVFCDSTGTLCRVTECECGLSDRCHPEILGNNKGVPVACIGECAPDAVCAEIRTQEGTGVSVECHCLPPPGGR